MKFKNERLGRVGELYLGVRVLSLYFNLQELMENIKLFYSKYLNLSFRENKGLHEVILFLVFLIFYKISRYIAIGDVSTAFENAYRLVEFEKWLGIFSEISIQQFFIGKNDLIRFINQFYTIVHLPATVIFFVWLYHKKADHYKFIRNGFLIANTLTIFFFISYPCAPPRMLNDLGFVDTLLEVSNINLYTGVFSGLFNQYAAVPSMHFGNAFLIGLVTMLLAKKIWLKIMIMLYPVFVLFVIVVTANHFFMDAIIGGFVVLFPYPLMIFKNQLLDCLSIRNNRVKGFG